MERVTGLESGAVASIVPLSDITKVRGANDVVALQFEVEADEASAVNIDEIKATVLTNTDGATGLADNQVISQVALYKGNVAFDANLLDRVSGSNLASGVATFGGFDIAIAANQKQTFVVTVSFVDGANTTLATNNSYGVKVTAISAEDDDNDDVTVSGIASLTSARDITVNDYGILTITADTNNNDNKDNQNSSCWYI